MKKIKVGQRYQHRKAPERVIEILKLRKAQPPRVGKRAVVRYISASSKGNIGLKAFLLIASIESMYKMYVPREPDWEV